MKTTPRIAVRRRAPVALFALAAALITVIDVPAFATEIVTAPAPSQTATITIVEPAIATTAVSDDTPLAPGKFEWTPNDAATGPVTIVVSLPAQMVHIYRGDVRIGRSTISSGREGHETPPGVYEILEKDRMHHSNKYDNAPMPYMQRLTWDGVALHAGKLPGYPASHGCVRLPLAFAEQLFQLTERGGRVIVADETNFSSAVLYPGAHVPVDPWTGLEPGMSAPATADTASTTTGTTETSGTAVSATAVSTLAGN
ncbi:L,D-transpeptidase family protein [Lysobacter sp. HA18]